MDMSAMGANEWLIVGSTILGPILAVQAQKAVERIKEASSRRERVFLTLMATRARQARVSVEHVNALNSIDLAYYGRRFFGKLLRSPATQDVVEAWNEYRRHLNPPPDQRPRSEAEVQAWEARGDELFVNLLERLAVANSYKFDREMLKSGSYPPEAHGVIESEQHRFRQLMLELLDGQRALPLDVRGMPRDEVMQAKLGAALDALSKISGGIGRSEVNNLAAEKESA